jgi:hypothetical protein
MNRQKEAGQALIAAIAGLAVVLMGFAGLGIDMGYLRYEKRLQQTAADSAALAGAAELLYGGTGVQDAAQHDAATNGFTGAVTSGCPPPSPGTTVGSISISVNVPPCSGPHNGAANYVETYVSEVQPTFFMRVLGINNETVTARAVASDNVNSTGCIYVLGTSSTSIDITGGSRITANNCTVLSDGGLTISNGSDLTASSIGLVGSSNVSGGSAATPTPTTGIAPAPNPLAYLTPPTVAQPCMPDPMIGNGRTSTLNPGTYCSFTLGGGAHVTLNSGVYVITGTQTPCFGLCIGNGVTVNGTSGVMFYEAGGTITLNGGANFNLTAPTTSNSGTGAVAGILFWQAASDPNPPTIDNGATSSLTGALYFPEATLTLAGGVSVSPYSIIVAQGLNLSNGTSLTSSGNYSSLPNGSPIKDALLVE